MTEKEYEVKHLELDVAAAKTRVAEAKSHYELQEMRMRAATEAKLTLLKGELEREQIDLKKVELSLHQARQELDQGFQ